MNAVQAETGTRAEAETGAASEADAGAGAEAAVGHAKRRRRAGRAAAGLLVAASLLAGPRARAEGDARPFLPPPGVTAGLGIVSMAFGAALMGGNDEHDAPFGMAGSAVFSSGAGAVMSAWIGWLASGAQRKEGGFRVVPMLGLRQGGARLEAWF